MVATLKRPPPERWTNNGRWGGLRESRTSSQRAKKSQAVGLMAICETRSSHLESLNSARLFFAQAFSSWPEAFGLSSP
jgi:hypothetical protein